MLNVYLPNWFRLAVHYDGHQFTQFVAILCGFVSIYPVDKLRVLLFLEVVTGKLLVPCDVILNDITFDLVLECECRRGTHGIICKDVWGYEGENVLIELDREFLVTKLILLRIDKVWALGCNIIENIIVPLVG